MCVTGGWGTQQFTKTGINPAVQTISTYMDTTGPLGASVLGGATATASSQQTSPSPSVTTNTALTTVSASASASSSSSSTSPAVVVTPAVTPVVTPASPVAVPVVPVTTPVASNNVVTEGVVVQSPVVQSVSISSPSNQVVPSPLPYIAPYTVVNWGQCGGNKVYCDRVEDCVDAVWTGASCNPGWQCNRYDATWWQCQPQQRRLLSRRLMGI